MSKPTVAQAESSDQTIPLSDVMTACYRRNLLNWDGMDGKSLRDVIENTRRLGALIEVVNAAEERGEHAEISPDDAAELRAEAGHLIQCLGVHALELLDAQATPAAPTPIRSPRVRSARRRAA